MCAISNQPAHHIPYMYTGTDQPWLAGATAHRLARRLFAGGHIGQGFPGDEDNGEMSAWWLWAAIGLYPLELGSGELVIGSPLLDDVTVARSDGSRLRIRSRRPHADAHVLRAARVNGAPLTVPCWRWMRSAPTSTWSSSSATTPPRAWAPTSRPPCARGTPI
jgi:putative alpha-1,2-mannosidase